MVLKVWIPCLERNDGMWKYYEAKEISVEYRFREKRGEFEAVLYPDLTTITFMTEGFLMENGKTIEHFKPYLQKGTTIGLRSDRSVIEESIK